MNFEEWRGASTTADIHNCTGLGWIDTHWGR